MSDLDPKNYFEKQDEMTQRNDLHTADLLPRANAFAAAAGHGAFTNEVEPGAKVATTVARTRRAARIAAALPIEVRDHFGSREETRTQFLTVRGAVLATATSARVGCKLTIQNLKNGKIAECHVISVEPVLKGVHQIEIEFTRPQPDFWPVQFPAEDSRVAEVKDNSTTASTTSQFPALETVQGAVKQERDPLLRAEDPKAASTYFAAESSQKLETQDDQLVVLADSLAPSFSPSKSLPNQERYSSKTATLDSVAQFRAANRAAHRRERQMKAFYSFLSIVTLGAAIVGVRSWSHHQTDRLPANVAIVAPSSAPVASSQPTPIVADAPVLAATVAPATVQPPVETTAETLPPNAVSETPTQTTSPSSVEHKAEETQVEVRHRAISAAIHKQVEVEEEPMALPLRAGDTTQAKAGVLSSVVSQISSKNPVLAAEPKKLVPAKLLHSVPAQYPPMARQVRTEGDVILDIDIDAAGNVSNARAVSGASLLRGAAVDAVRRWKYQPATLGEKPVASSQTVKLDFHLR